MPNIPQDTERKNRTQDTNTAHNRRPHRGANVHVWSTQSYDEKSQGRKCVSSLFDKFLFYILLIVINVVLKNSQL